MDITDKHKQDLEGEIVEKALKEYEEGRITRDDLKTIADFVIAGMKQVNTKEGVTNFLSSLSGKWPFFDKIVIIEAGHQKEEEEVKVYSEAVDMVHHGNIDSAITLAKTMTD